MLTIHFVFRSSPARERRARKSRIAGGDRAEHSNPSSDHCNSNDWSAPLDRPEPIGLLVAAVRRRLKQAVDARVRHHGLSPQQFWLLVAIREVEGYSLQRLAARQRMDAPTASRVVAGLVRRGLVRMDPDPADGRRARLRLTPRGRRVAQQMLALALEVREATAHGLTVREQQQARALLRRMLDNLERFDPRITAPRSRSAARAARSVRPRSTISSRSAE